MKCSVVVLVSYLVAFLLHEKVRAWWALAVPKAPVSINTF